MKFKRINLGLAALTLEIGKLKVWADFDDAFDKYPEDPNGVSVSDEQVRIALTEWWDFGIKLIENITGTLPEVEIPEETEVEETVDDTESKVYPSKFHHTLVGGSDGGVSFVTCPGQIRDYAKVSCEGINMPQHGSTKGTLDSSNRQCWWNMHKEPDKDTDIKCVTEDGEVHYYRINKSNVMVYGTCK